MLTGAMRKPPGPFFHPACDIIIGHNCAWWQPFTLHRITRIEYRLDEPPHLAERSQTLYVCPASFHIIEAAEERGETVGGAQVGKTVLFRGLPRSQVGPKIEYSLTLFRAPSHLFGQALSRFARRNFQVLRG